MRPIRRVLSRLASLHGTPRGIAGGITLGFSLSLIPIPFAGMALALALAPPLRLNLPATYLGTAIVNPVTGSAFYFAELWLGMRLMGSETPSWTELRSLDAQAWLSLLGDLAAPFFLGAGLMATGCAVVVFPICWWLVHGLQSQNKAAQPSA